MIEPIDDKWILDLSTKIEDRNKRWNIFSNFLENREAVYFSDHKRKNSNYLSFFRMNDIIDITSRPEVFYSKDGYMINDNFEGIPFTGSLLSMDGIEHRRARKIISSVFTRSKIMSLEPMIRSVVKDCFDDFIKKNERSGDIYNDLCLQIPLEVNRRMMGIKKDDKDPVVELTKFVIGNDDPRYGDGDPIVWLKSCRMLRRYAIKLGREKEKNPSNDLTSMLLSSTGDNSALSIEDFAQFFMLLVIAGMETTTHTLAHGIKSLYDNRDQLDMLRSEFGKYINTACEEILRLNPPVLYFRRTALENTEVNGNPVNKGDRVAMWYICANNDDTKFSDPLSFKIDRENAGLHTTFGAPGIHHCLGAQLARLEMKIFYEYMLEYFPNLNTKKHEGEMLYGKSRWGNGFRNFPVSW